VRLPAGSRWQYGDRVEIWGSPVTPPEAEDFSYRDYLARRGIHTYLNLSFCSQDRQRGCQPGYGRNLSTAGSRLQDAQPHLPAAGGSAAFGCVIGAGARSAGGHCQSFPGYRNSPYRRHIRLK